MGVQTAGGLATEGSRRLVGSGLATKGRILGEDPFLL